MDKYSKSSKSKTSGNHIRPSSGAEHQGNLDRVAEELVGLARARLPDGVFKGDLTSLEADVRQDAVLMALGWFLRDTTQPASQGMHSWHAPRAIAAALKIQKRDYGKLRKRERKAMQSMTGSREASQSHPSLMSQSDWTSSTLKSLVRRAIGIALRDRLITHANAAIALLVYVNGMAVQLVARQLGVNRSSIYQHLSRVRRCIPDIINGIEMPLSNLP